MSSAGLQVGDADLICAEDVCRAVDVRLAIRDLHIIPIAIATVWMRFHGVGCICELNVEQMCAE